jgi:peptidoglycan/xylan/chitin deacetylase (PgdA/CDA1 family)
MPERADNSAKWIVRRGLKAAVATALCAAGARRIVREARRRAAGGPRVLIVSYHRPTGDFHGDALASLPSLLISAATLKRQVEQLARERDVVSLEDACRLLSSPPSPRAQRASDVAVITFDDGYAGVHDEALPVLRALGVPATVFVPTGYVGTRRRLAHDRIFGALRQLAGRGVAPHEAGLEPRLQALLDGCAAAGPASTLDRLIARLAHGDLAAVAAALERRAGLSEGDLPPGTRIMTWEELREAKAAGIDVGGHTVEHCVLSSMPLSRARAEIEGCRDDIAAHLDAPPRHFAYPNGYHTPGVRRALREAGFTAAVTTEDVENRRGCDPFTLKRKSLWENSTLGAVGYSASVAACNFDGVFGAIGWQRPTPGERPDAGEAG